MPSVWKRAESIRHGSGFGSAMYDMMVCVGSFTLQWLFRVSLLDISATPLAIEYPAYSTGK